MSEHGKASWPHYSHAVYTERLHTASGFGSNNFGAYTVYLFSFVMYTCIDYIRYC